jgi:hypothetical protein
VQDEPSRDLEKAALALAFPAGATAYFIHGLTTKDWANSAGWIPSVFSALALAGLLFWAKPEEQIGVLTAPALTMMHVVGGATLTLLVSIAMPDIPTLPALVPMLLWTQGAALLAFIATDLVTLALIKYGLPKR